MERRTLANNFGSVSPHRLTEFQPDARRDRATGAQAWLSNMTEEEIRKKKAFVWAWGKNKNGELSLGVTKDSQLPRQVKGFTNKNNKETVVPSIEFISSGANHSAAITSEGELYVCGSYLHEKLGIEDLRATNVLRFTLCTNISPPNPGLSGYRVTKVACGDYHTLWLWDDGTVHSWGGTLYKKLGQKKDGNYPGRSPSPYLIESLLSCYVVDIDCGDFHSMALDEEGRLYTWGGGGLSYNKGQWGHGDENDYDSPEQVKFFEGTKVTKISAGGFHTLVATEDGDAYAWGQGVYGEWGYGEFYNVNKPNKVKMPKVGPNLGASKFSNTLDDDDGEKVIIKQISAGAHHSMIMSEEGQLYTFGYGQHGQLGLRNNINYWTAHLVKDFLNQPLKYIAAGWHHSLALSKRGDLYAWGYGESGQLGIGSTESRTQFTLVESIGDKNISKIFAGGSHSWVVLNELDPVRANYRYPEPLNDKSPQNVAAPNKPLFRDIDEDEEEKLENLLVGPTELSNQEDDPIQSIDNQDIMLQQELEKREFKCKDLQCVYTDTKLSHRFIRFELLDEYEEEGKERVDEFIREIYLEETGTLQHRVQNDEDITNAQGKVVSHSRGKRGKFFTINIVCNPQNNIDPPDTPNDKEDEIEIKGGYKNSIGVMLLIRAEDMQIDPHEIKLWKWVIMFYNRMKNYVSENFKFFELRPFMYARPMDEE